MCPSRRRLNHLNRRWRPWRWRQLCSEPKHQQIPWECCRRVRCTMKIDSHHTCSSTVCTTKFFEKAYLHRSLLRFLRVDQPVRFAVDVDLQRHQWTKSQILFVWQGGSPIGLPAKTPQIDDLGCLIYFCNLLHPFRDAFWSAGGGSGGHQAAPEAHIGCASVCCSPHWCRSGDYTALSQHSCTPMSKPAVEGQASKRTQA